jgi:hypothetical protein
MADKKISALTAATTPLDGTEVLPLVQSGATVKVANNDLRPKQIQSNATSGVLQIVGPAAAATRVMTVPDANFTAARTDAAQSFTGTQTFATGVNVGTPSGAFSALVGLAATSANTQYSFLLLQNRATETATTGASIDFGGAVNWLGRVSTQFTGGTGAGDSSMSFHTASSGVLTERVVIDSVGNTTVKAGNLLVGTTNNASSARIMCNGGLAVQTNGNGNRSMLVNLVSNENFNGAATTIYVGRDGTTSRSINAGGTVNASGADYAEYMTKSGNFTVAKGDVVGIDAQGKLTNVFSDAISFVVKSTDPSYVGGDTWGTEEAIGLKEPSQPYQDQAIQKSKIETDEEFAIRKTIQAAYIAEKAVFDAALEAARTLVDRVAFAGQVPVNVLGATAGQYIVPVDDNGSIKGQAVSNPTFEQYQSAVGKVIAIEADGRARIIVKVA